MNNHDRLCRRTRGFVDLAQISRCIAGNPAIAVGHTEDVWQASRDQLVRHTDIDRERDVVFRCSCRCSQTNGRLVTALKGMHTSFIHFFDLSSTNFWLCLRITKKRLKWRAAHGFDAASRVDVGNRHLRTIAKLRRGIGRPAGCRVNQANFYRACCPGNVRNGKARGRQRYSCTR